MSMLADLINILPFNISSNNFLSNETFLSIACLIVVSLVKDNDKDNEKNWEEDAELVERVKNGDHSAYIILYDKYKEKIYKFCFYLLLKRIDPEEDAKDAMKETFTRVLKRIHTIKVNRAFFKFLRKTAYRICMDSIKEPQAQKPKSDDPEPVSIEIHDGTQNYEDELIEKEIKEIINKALNSLDEKYRLAVIHVHLMGYTYQEAAEIMECKEDDIRRWVHRGMLQLKKDKTLRSYRELI